MEPEQALRERPMLLAAEVVLEVLRHLPEVRLALQVREVVEAAALAQVKQAQPANVRSPTRSQQAAEVTPSPSTAISSGSNRLPVF